MRSVPSRAIRGAPDRGDDVVVERDLALVLVDAGSSRGRARGRRRGSRPSAAPWRRRGSRARRPSARARAANQASKLCECWAVSWLPPPPGVRMTSGQPASPPNMYADLGRVVDDLVHRERQKLSVMISTTGRAPAIAAPIAGADEALLGDRRVAHAVGAELVHQPRGDACRSRRRRRPPRPCTNTRSSRASSSRSARRSASRTSSPRFRAVDGAHRPRPPSKTSSSSPNGRPAACARTARRCRARTRRRRARRRAAPRRPWCSHGRLDALLDAPLEPVELAARTRRARSSRPRGSGRSGRVPRCSARSRPCRGSSSPASATEWPR